MPVPARAGRTDAFSKVMFVGLRVPHSNNIRRNRSSIRSSNGDSGGVVASMVVCSSCRKSIRETSRASAM